MNNNQKIMIGAIVAILIMFFAHHLFFSEQSRCVNNYLKSSAGYTKAQAEIRCIKARNK